MARKILTKNILELGTKIQILTKIKCDYQPSKCIASNNGLSFTQRAFPFTSTLHNRYSVLFSRRYFSTVSTGNSDNPNKNSEKQNNENITYINTKSETHNTNNENKSEVNQVIDSSIVEEVYINKEEEQGNEHFMKEDFNTAIFHYNQAIKQYDQLYDICRATFMRSQSYKKLGDLENAYKGYLSCLTYFEKHKANKDSIESKRYTEEQQKLEYIAVNSYAGLGYMFLDNPTLPLEFNLHSHHLSLAFNFFDKGLEIGNYADLLYGRGLCYIKTGNLNDAKTDFSILIDIDNKFSPGYHGRGDANLGLGKYIEALNDFQNFIETYPTYHKNFSSKTSRSSMDPDKILRDVKLKRGICAYHTQDYPTAFSELSKLLEEDEENALAFYYRGKVHLARKNFTSAIGDNTNAIDLNPNIPGAYLDRSKAYQKLGRHDESLRDKEAHFNLIERKKILLESLSNITKS
eukprot:TRINITY_DN5399_c0_g2_i1.p1 TRINITY_DN5399_c0_g2~~TRINITY_DN5399_c0_g2_i1.p1  ORF type:complete len:462 (-),score=58.35 TRINITY_DN5399_c0_g2_i1:66-1451(-)